MSKSPNPLWPALGITGLIFGGAYGVMTRSYKAEEAELARAQAERAEAKVASIQAGKDDLAAQIAQVQEDARARIAELEARPVALSLTAPAPQTDSVFGLGRPALAEEIAAWDVDVLPDGRGLPAGSGDVLTGEELFADKCGACHGDFGEGVDNWPVLAGGFDTLADEDPVKTVGSYWPYLSTVWDYVHRSMPFGEAGTLSADETYAIVAYILYSNDLVDDEFVLTHENFTDVQMHNTDGFIVDDRPQLEYSAWRAEPCMQNCKEDARVTMRSVFLVETPPEGGSESVMNHGTLENVPSFTADGPSFIPVAAPKPEVTAEETPEPTPVAQTAPEGDDTADLIAAGEKVFKKCQSCHQVGPSAKNRSGPHLNGLIGRDVGSVDGFKYSRAMAEMGGTWDAETLAAFLADPKGYLKGTKMSFRGLKKDEDIAAVTEYLKTYAD